jgi:hypothetical protein
VQRIAKTLGAELVERLPDVGGGAMGALRMATLLQTRLQPGRGERPGRPTVPNWTRRPKVPRRRRFETSILFVVTTT